MGQQRHQMLVRAGMHVDDMLVGLEALVGTRVPERRARLLDDRDRLLAAPGRDAADDVVRRAGSQDVFAQRRIAVDVAAWVALDRHELDGMGGIGVDLGNRPHGARVAGVGDQPIAAGARIEDTDLDPALHAVSPLNQAQTKNAPRPSPGPAGLTRHVCHPAREAGICSQRIECWPPVKRSVGTFDAS
jgi:hypothetical protein